MKTKKMCSPYPNNTICPASASLTAFFRAFAGTLVATGTSFTLSATKAPASTTAAKSTKAWWSARCRGGDFFGFDLS
jgi:hypothetical protein